MPRNRKQLDEAQATVTLAANDRIDVSGELSFANALEVKQQGDQLLAQADSPCYIDFSNLSRAGSAGVSVLLGWLRAAKAQDKDIEFANLPSDLMGVAQVSGVDQIIPLSGGPSSSTEPTESTENAPGHAAQHE